MRFAPIPPCRIFLTPQPEARGRRPLAFFAQNCWPRRAYGSSGRGARDRLGLRPCSLNLFRGAGLGAAGYDLIRDSALLRDPGIRLFLRSDELEAGSGGVADRGWPGSEGIARSMAQGGHAPVRSHWEAFVPPGDGAGHLGTCTRAPARRARGGKVCQPFSRCTAQEQGRGQAGRGG